MRSIFFLGLCILGVVSPWWFFALGAVLYAMRYSAYELVALAVLLDVSFGVTTFRIPFPFAYTVATLTALIVIAYSKPFITLTPRA